MFGTPQAQGSTQQNIQVQMENLGEQVTEKASQLKNAAMDWFS